MDKKEFEGKMKEEGIMHVYEWRDEPGTQYSPHRHKGRVVLHILEGDIKLWFGDEEMLLRSGDQFEVPVDKEHAAQVGTLGCTFLVGEMIEGDS